MRSRKEVFIERVRPEVTAGGFVRDDGIVEFYLRVQTLLRPEYVVLDLGAGRGEMASGLRDDFRSGLLRIKGKVAKFVGTDVDPAVLSNPLVDEAKVILPDGTLPFEDRSFDLIVCDWVIEHIERPSAFVAEVNRVLKPGGWFCARTPNKWGFIAIGARLFPASLEGRVLAKLQPNRNERDIFPKWYRMNTKAELFRHFNRDEWDPRIYVSNPLPLYHGYSQVIFRLLTIYQNIVPESLSTVLLAFIQKRPLS